MTMKAFTSFILLSSALCFFLARKTEASSADKDYYTAAVFEHATFISKTASPEEIIGRNLYYYHKAAAAAKSKGADVIVFPEYGIFLAENRTSVKKYLENIPDPTDRVNPCEEGLNFADRTILRTLSCMAKQNSMYIVANMGDIQTCEDDELDCPSDGAFFFNANVVFDRKGVLVMKYHKEHLYFELAMDLARKQQDTTFKTDFGTFATYTCFDILFERMGNVSRTVDAILFPTMWFFLGPQFSSVQFFQSWAIGNNATLVAANTHVLDFFSVGSGIFHGGALGYTYNPDGTSKVVVARVPKSGRTLHDRDAASSIVAITADGEFEMKDDGKSVPDSCWTTHLESGKKPHCIAGNTTGYTFVKLTKKSDHLQACNNGMCCSLDYTAASDLTETYYLGVFNRTYNSYDRYNWCEENCVLVRCEDNGTNSCSSFPMRANTRFHHVRLSAEFSSKNVYPSVIESKMRLVPTDLWKYELRDHSGYKGVINMRNKEGVNLIVAGFKSRCYRRDPPYIR